MHKNAPECPSYRDLKAQHPHLFELSDLRGILAIVSDWLQIFVIAWISVYSQSWLVYFIAVLAIGFKQISLAEALVHQASHHNLFKTRSLNSNLEFFFSVPFILSAHDYSKDHNRHHKNVNIPEIDPALHSYGHLGLLEPGINVIWRVLVRPFTGWLAYQYVTYILPLFFREASTRRKIEVICFYGMAIGIFLAFGHLDYFLMYWIVPLVFIHRQLIVINEVAEHYRAKGMARQRMGWINLLSHNDGYHYVHHLYPTIPWFRLPEAQRILAPCLPEVETCHGFILHPLWKMLTYKEESVEPEKAAS